MSDSGASSRPFVLATGGTGGHVFPAQALAAELLRRGHAVVLVTDKSRGGGYHTRFPGVDLHFVRAASPTGRGVLGKVGALAEIGLGTIGARGLLKSLRPAIVVGFGGFPSLPTMLAAISLRLPTVLHEQNALLGRVNRLLMPGVSAIALSFAATAGIRPADRDKVHVTGNPVRETIAVVRDLPYSPPAAAGAVRLLILGGSQGARILSEIVPPALIGMAPELRMRLRVTQQCRRDDLDGVRESYRAADIAADLADFFDDIPVQLASAHLVISRSGASTMAELTVAGRPSILVPFAHATDDHQTANAQAAVAVGGALAIAEVKFSAQILRESLEALLADGTALASMAAAAREIGAPRATSDLADLVEQLAQAHGAAEGGRAAA